MELVDEFGDEFGKQPDWPAFEDVLDDREIWRKYPHISPPLRKAITGLPYDEAHALYFDVASGSTNTFYLSKNKNNLNSPLAWPSVESDENFDSALKAANIFGERTLFPLLEMEEEKPERTILKRARKKLKRNMASLDKEENRLQELALEQIKAEALQAELYRFKQAQGLEKVEVTHPEHGPMTVALNPHISPTENMEKYFKLAAKAQRGFPHVKRRRRELLKQLAQLENGELPGQAPLKQRLSQNINDKQPLPKRYKGLAVALFRSSDGFTIIRGKNKKANHDILSKAASPFDYWLHVADGPSSHIILKRDHPGHEVPETTLTEAAILCGLKSYRNGDGKADVMYALVKDVRKVKGFAPGQVLVDKKLGTIRVDLDPTLEKRLA
jgi:predicted ribosome quality control (RQC) complex YloA/Tae2 family protein